MLTSASTISLTTYSVFSILFSLSILSCVFLPSTLILSLPCLTCWECIRSFLAFRYFAFYTLHLFLGFVETQFTLNKLYSFECTLWWVLTNWNVCVTTTNIKIENISSVPQSSPCASAVILLIPLLALGNQQPSLSHFSSDFSRIVYKMNQKVCSILFLVFHLILLIFLGIVYVGGLFLLTLCRNMPQFDNPVTNWWTFRMFSVWRHYE